MTPINGSSGRGRQTMVKESKEVIVTATLNQRLFPLMVPRLEHILRSAILHKYPGNEAITIIWGDVCTGQCQTEDDSETVITETNKPHYHVEAIGVTP